MFFSVAWLRLITLSLITLPFVTSHEDVLCKFVPLEFYSPFCLLNFLSHFLCIILRSTGESTRRTVRYRLLSFQQLCGIQCLRSICRKYPASRYCKSILT